MKEIKLTLNSKTAEADLNTLIRDAASFVPGTHCKIDESVVRCENSGEEKRVGSARTEGSRTAIVIDDPIRVQGFYRYYISSSVAKRYSLEVQYTFRNIRDSREAISGLGADGYVWAITAYTPDWLIPGTIYQGDYTESMIQNRIDTRFSGRQPAIPVDEYLKRYGRTAAEQIKYIHEFMRREHTEPLPIYEEFHPSLYNINIDNSTNRLGEHIGREIAIRKNGFYEYEWQNPTDLESRRKTIFMKLFEYRRHDGSELKWVISAGAYQDEVYAPILRLRTEIFMLFLAISLIFTLGFVALINYNLLRPLAELLSGVRQVNEGNLAVRVSVQASDEIGFLATSFNSMVESLKRTGEALRAKTAELERSETKYRNLVENSGEIIFSMNMSGNILTMNRAVANYLGHRPNSLVGKDFVSLSADKENLQILRGAIRDVQDGAQAQFRTHLLTRTGEPLEMDIRLERAESDSGYLIFGRALTVKEDELNRLIVRESQVYETGNFITKINMITDRLTGPIQKFLPDDIVANVRLCLREALINAIEHGNLEIDFETKTHAMANGDYLEFIAMRQNLPEFASRKIKIEYALSDREVSYRIADQGKGFDHRSVKLKPLEKDKKLSHGRGLLLVRATFDRVEFNEKGNEILLVKYLDKRPVV